MRLKSLFASIIVIVMAYASEGTPCVSSSSLNGEDWTYVCSPAAAGGVTFTKTQGWLIGWPGPGVSGKR